jgi:hypothetical protein
MPALAFLESHGCASHYNQPSLHDDDPWSCSIRFVVACRTRTTGTTMGQLIPSLQWRRITSSGWPGLPPWPLPHPIHQDGLMPKVNWQKVKVEVIFELTWFLHRKVQAYFDSVSLSSTNQGKVVDVYTLLFKEKANIYVLHDKFIVYVVTF